MASAWNMFVKKVYHEGKKKNPNFSFGEALTEASQRKAEMTGGMNSGTLAESASFGGSRRRRRSRRTRRKYRGGMNAAPKSEPFSNSATVGGKRRRRKSRKHSRRH